MSLLRYAEYKDSCVSWLSEVPTHWEARPLKYLAKLVTGLTPPTDVHENYAEEGFPWIRPEDINENGAVTHASKFLSEDGAEIARHLVPLSTLICCIGTIGKAGIIGAPAATNQQITAASFRGSAKYFYYATCAARTEIETSATGNVLKILNTERLGRIRFPDPPEDEQSAIAAFLDRETGKIDALIAQQEKLLTLLAEKRQATISHAVTRGLNPNAPMKDSGVPWLGDVPTHWEVGSLKRFWSVTDCKHITAEFVEDGIPLASIREVQARFVDLVEAKRTTETFYEDLVEGGREPRAGDLIFSRNATVGEVAQVPASCEKFAMGQDVCLLRRTSNSMSSDYMQYVIQSSAVVEQLNTLMIGSTFKRVNVEQIRSLVVPSPPESEQDEISLYLGEFVGTYDTLAREVICVITLMKERRSALIAAAVTGKIDVCGVVKEQAA